MCAELDRIVEWFEKQCNGTWEHSFGIRIETCDNPGWLVEIDLKGTPLEHKIFRPFRVGDFSNNAPEKPWIDITVKEGRFRGAGDTRQLCEIIKRFIDWADTESNRMEQSGSHLP